jgi:peptidoglycan hydrolase FlgJ
MSVANTIPAKQAMEAYQAAAQAKPGSRAAKARTATYFQNMLESMVSGLGPDGPLGSGQSGGGAWRGFLMDEMSKSITKTSSLGIAPQVYREMMRFQEGSRP